MKSRHLIALGATLVGAVTLPALEITLPAETTRLAESPLPGYALATTHCYTCHSTDYVRSQPPAMSRAAWKATVVKMQKTFGAPIPDDAIEPVADYLVRTYGAERGGGTTPAPGAARASGNPVSPAASGK